MFSDLELVIEEESSMDVASKSGQKKSSNISPSLRSSDNSSVDRSSKIYSDSFSSYKRKPEQVTDLDERIENIETSPRVVLRNLKFTGAH